MRARLGYVGTWAAALPRLGRDRRGTTAIEFGMLAMPFLAIVCAIFEIAYVDFESETLQAALSTAARQIMVGALQGAKVTDSQGLIDNYLCQKTGRRTLPSVFDCTKLVIDVRPAASFADSDTSKTFYRDNTNKFCPGSPGQIVVLRVDYPLPAIFPLSLFNRYAGLANDVPNQSGWFHILLGSALFQNESYANAYTPPKTC